MSDLRKMPNGPHKGKSIEAVVIKYPDYVQWLARQPESPGFRWLYQHIESCIEAFDAKPYSDAGCTGRRAIGGCDRSVVRYSLYRNSCDPVFWCDECDPYQVGASTGSLSIYQDYNDLMNHAAGMGASRPMKRNAIRILAEAKGLIGNLTERKLADFFCPSTLDEP